MQPLNTTRYTISVTYFHLPSDVTTSQIKLLFSRHWFLAWDMLKVQKKPVSAFESENSHRNFWQKYGKHPSCDRRKKYHKKAQKTTNKQTTMENKSKAQQVNIHLEGPENVFTKWKKGYFNSIVPKDIVLFSHSYSFTFKLATFRKKAFSVRSMTFWSWTTTNFHDTISFYVNW